jgi:phage repressor protein C with HTH and peptisase S24 domain
MSRIKELLKELNLKQKEFAQKIGVTPHTVMNWEKEKKFPNKTSIKTIAEVFGVNFDWLLTGEGGMFIQPALDPEKDFVYIPMYKDIRAAAGAGSLVPDVEIISSRLAFRRDWIKERGVSADDASIIHVLGDSMFPTLINSDVLLVDSSQKRLIRDKIYVFRIDDELVVKRYKARAEDILTLSSDNPHIGDMEIDLNQNADVIGRVVWVAREY